MQQRLKQTDKFYN